MSFFQELISFFQDLLQSASPSLLEWPTLPLAKKIGESIKLVLEVGGLWEFVRFCDRRLFKRRSRLEEENELLTQDKVENGKEITKLTAELAEATKKIPGTAIGKGQREWRDRNEESAIRELETWFQANAESIGDIALRVAKFHISRAIPDPTRHLNKASTMLQLARDACPENQEIRELWREFDIVNAGLQEQLLRDGNTQIAWNKEMSARLLDRGEALVPIIQTFRDVAEFTFNTGRRRLAPIFADRAASLAESGGRTLKPLWVAAETMAASYHATEGRGAGALRPIGRALREARTFLDARDLIVL